MLCSWLTIQIAAGNLLIYVIQQGFLELSPFPVSLLHPCLIRQEPFVRHTDNVGHVDLVETVLVLSPAPHH
jgi:hypothetical protein